MNEPLVLDGRNGLTQEILESLPEARELFLAVKDAATGILGYRLDPTEAGPDFAAISHLAVVNVASGGANNLGKAFTAPIPRPDVWERIVAMLRPGDLMEMWAGPDRIGILVRGASGHFANWVVRADRQLHISVML